MYSQVFNAWLLKKNQNLEEQVIFSFLTISAPFAVSLLNWMWLKMNKNEGLITIKTKHIYKKVNSVKANEKFSEESFFHKLILQLKTLQRTMAGGVVRIQCRAVLPF